jgi:hypothetical protein
VSLETDMTTVLQAYPTAHSHRYESTGGSKIMSWVIRSGFGDDLPVGPSAFSEKNAWRYACERLEKHDG